MYCRIRRNEGLIGAEGCKNPSSVQQTPLLFSCRIPWKHWKSFSNEFSCIVLSNGNYMNMDCGISSLKICSLYYFNFESILMQCLFSSSVYGRLTAAKSRKPISLSNAVIVSWNGKLWYCSYAKEFLWLTTTEAPWGDFLLLSELSM